MRTPLTLAILAGAVLASGQALAFCGFYVAQAGTKLYNQASKVVLARSEGRTVLTMANDYQGDVKDFAVVIPVPTVLKREQINVAENRIIDHLDRYTAPRLVEYHDPNPCMRVMIEQMMPSAAMAMGAARADGAREMARAKGVTIEAEYQVGEYDILILSARESEGLVSWLKESGYRLPDGAEPVVRSYLRQDMKFFVAKVNLEKKKEAGFSYLRPLQVAYESEKFMLPIRLGTVNARGPQELFIFALTRKGRIETVNYRTDKIPSDKEIPIFVKDEFGAFYKAMFDKLVDEDNMRRVYLEYAWDMNWCDPCAADPIPVADLRNMGAWWLAADRSEEEPGPSTLRRPRPPKGDAREVFVTRLHLRYTADTFPEDLVFQETADRSNFQGRYILRHPFKDEASCPAAVDYRRALRERMDQEAVTLAALTGWDRQRIERKMDMSVTRLPEGGRDQPGRGGQWYERMWNPER